MNNLESTLIERGIAREDVTIIVDELETLTAAAAREQAAQVLHVIFLRVGRDSVAGCALRRALGFSGGVSLARAAKDFGVTKQYLEAQQAELEAKLGDLSLGARRVAGVKDAPPPVAGPFPGDRLHR